MYDNPLRMQYRFPAIHFDAGVGDVCTIDVPVRPGQTQGRGGRVVSVHLEAVTVEFTAGDMVAGSIQIGDGSDADKYFDSGALVTTSEVNTKNIVNVPDDGAKVDIEVGRSTLTCTFNAATGTGDGTADVVVTVEWD
jgi:hypothetical protein